MTLQPLKLLAVAMVVATCLFPVELQARDGFFAKRRASRQTESYAQQPVCTEDGCTTPGGGGLRINENGGFEGQLTDQQFSSYFAGQGGAYVPTEQAVVVERSIVVAAAEPTGTVQQAMAVMQEAKESMARAEAMLQQSLEAEQHRTALAAIELEAKIKTIELTNAKELSALRSQLANLTPEGR